MKIYDEVNNRWIDIRSLKQYKRKKMVLRDTWIGLGLVMILLPPVAIMPLALLAGFLSLSFLDESQYQLENIR